MLKIVNEVHRSSVKQAFSTRRVPLSAIKAIDTRQRRPRPGDVVLARVEEVGRLARIELPNGRKSALYEGDELLLVYGNRYAPDAYEALIPVDMGPCHLAAAGGLASRIVETNLTFANERRTPTRIVPLGLCTAEDGMVLNLSDFKLPAREVETQAVPVITVFGASMNAGKTTTVAGIVRGLARQGLKVGAVKITGTCSGGDLWKFQDAGAYRTLDFTDAGMATSYKVDLATVRTGAKNLLANLQASDCDAIVIEIADGLHQHETAALLQDRDFQSLVDHWVFAADTAASIVIGMQIAAGNYGLKISGVSGSVTASPLALREACELTDAPIYSLEELEDGRAAFTWLDSQVRAVEEPLALQRLAV
ncbi:MAG: molybdopterin-guanine dinucleotide biosynthesis protein MobB [Gammaproteobacteria bacterium]|nr:molybdopterin-guanine dinucleotide biosynthesis protein MobB [Gammaproteobacteria bacterium]